MPKINTKSSKICKTASKKKPKAAVRESEQIYLTTKAIAKENKRKVLFEGQKLTPSTTMEKMNMVRNGVSKTYLEKVKTITQFDYQKLAKVLVVTKATLINKKKAKKFKVLLSERIVGLADLYEFGFEVFEDQGKFNSWMVAPNTALGGQTPYDLIDNQYGREEVRNILGRVQYGIYS